MGSKRSKDSVSVSEHIINAIATYICVESSISDLFSKEVDTTEIAKMLCASVEEQEKAYLRAKEILNIFFHDNMNKRKDEQMSRDEKCKCPMCNQGFTPENGLTPEEHIAKGIIKRYREMQDIPHNFELPCPRCGYMRMRPELAVNAYSRYADIYICPECGENEALTPIPKNNFHFLGWYIVSEILKSVSGLKCKDYIPEKGNPYPLCDNSSCKESRTCNISAHMDDMGGYNQYDK